MTTFAGLESTEVVNLTMLLRKYGFVQNGKVCLELLESLLIEHKLQETANAARSVG